jgi:hypothetical protein
MRGEERRGERESLVGTFHCVFNPCSLQHRFHNLDKNCLPRALSPKRIHNHQQFPWPACQNPQSDWMCHMQTFLKPSSRLQIRGFESILRTTAAVSHHVADQRQTERQRQRPRAGIACFIEEHLDAFEP